MSVAKLIKMNQNYSDKILFNIYLFVCIYNLKEYKYLCQITKKLNDKLA